MTSQSMTDFKKTIFITCICDFADAKFFLNFKIKVLITVLN